MDSTAYSQFTTSRQLNYSYLKIEPKNPSLGYILFLHGFPSSSYDWHYQVDYFYDKGYGVVAPDLLGYGKTSKPLNVQAYRGKLMATDIKEILVHEEIRQVLAVAHDWGSYLLSCIVHHFPELLSKLAFIDVGYQAPGHGLSLQNVTRVNSMVQEAMGFTPFAYFFFFNEDDAVELMNKNSHSMRSLMYSNDTEQLKKYMGTVGGTRTWVSEGKVADPVPYFTAEDKKHYDEALASGYAAPLNWYRSQLADVNAEDDAALPEERGIVKQPTLLFTTNMFITVAADFAAQMKPVVPDFKVVKVDGGHWVQIEKPDEVNKALDEFFER